MTFQQPGISAEQQAANIIKNAARRRDKRQNARFFSYGFVVGGGLFFTAALVTSAFWL
jgi:hypothetical protein